MYFADIKNMRILYHEETEQFTTTGLPSSEMPDIHDMTWILNHPQKCQLSDLPDALINASDNYFETDEFYDFAISMYLLKEYGLFYFKNKKAQDHLDATAVTKWVDNFKVAIHLERLHRMGFITLQDSKIWDLNPATKLSLKMYHMN